MGLREAVLEGSRRHRCCCLPGTWGRRRRCRWIRPAFSRPSDPPHGWSCSESETETETASSEPPSTLLTLWCTESVFRVEACLESGRVARQRGRRSGWWVTWLEEEGNGWQAGGGRGATGIGGSASLLHHSSPHQNPAASEPRRATNRPRPRHGVDQPRRAALAVAARLPGPPPPRPRRALPLHSPPARPPPPRAERYPRHSRSHAACKASRAGLTGRVRSCCGCRRVAVPAGGDLQRAGSGADQHCAGDARPADEHTGGRRDGDAGAAGGPEGAGWGLRRQVPRQAAPSPGRFPPWLGRHSRQCRVKFAVATASLSSFYFLVQLMLASLQILGVVILCALNWNWFRRTSASRRPYLRHLLASIPSLTVRQDGLKSPSGRYVMTISVNEKFAIIGPQMMSFAIIGLQT
jgi:hypothetical protein